jgi:hypothetical protein
MSRIAILSDAHLLIQAERFREEDHRSPRGETALQNFSNVVSQVIGEEPEAVILAGDMFDEREKSGEWIADSEAAKYWPDIRRELGRLAKCARYGVYALRGNHDSAPVLKELQDSLGEGFHFVRDKEEEIGERRVYFMETRYRQGSYKIPEEALPRGGEILIMHETLPWGMPGLEEEVFRELGRRFSLVFNGHMHHYARAPLDVPNLYSLPALIPSRELKGNFTVEYRWPGDLEKPRVKESPFGYLLLEGDEISFKRYSPVQSIVNILVEGGTPGEVVTGINEVYSRLMEREDRDNLWVWISARGVTFEDTLKKEVNKYSEINTMDIDIKAKKGGKKPVEPKGLDKMITLSELEARVLTALPEKEKELAQKLFGELFTGDNLSRNMDSGMKVLLFRRLLELASPHYGVPPERRGGFLGRIDPLWKRR